MNCCLLTKLNASRTKADSICMCVRAGVCVVKKKQGQMHLLFAKAVFWSTLTSGQP